MALSKLRIHLVLPMLFVAYGCAFDGAPQSENTDLDVELGAAEQDVIAECEDQPPCDCALKNTPSCKDPDNDGIRTMSDSCPFTYNPGQENCDGDGLGDACDSDNAVPWHEPEFLEHFQPIHTFQRCMKADVFATESHEYTTQQWTQTWRTDHWANLCGPSGTGTVSRGSTFRPVLVECAFRDPFPRSCNTPNGTLLGLPSCAHWGATPF